MYARIFLDLAVPISSLGNNSAVDHDPISAERSVHSAIRNARPKKYSRNKMAV